MPDSATSYRLTGEPVPDLTVAERAFISALVAGRSASEAYREAFSTNSTRSGVRTAASRLRRRPDVVRAVELARDASAAARLKAVEDARTEAAEAVTDDLILTGMLVEARRTGKGSSHAARVQAWAHLGRYRGLWQDNVNLQTPQLAAMMRAAEARRREHDARPDTLTPLPDTLPQTPDNVRTPALTPAHVYAREDADA